MRTSFILLLFINFQVQAQDSIHQEPLELDDFATVLCGDAQITSLLYIDSLTAAKEELEARDEYLIGSLLLAEYEYCSDFDDAAVNGKGDLVNIAGYFERAVKLNHDISQEMETELPYLDMDLKRLFMHIEYKSGQLAAIGDYNWAKLWLDQLKWAKTQDPYARLSNRLSEFLIVEAFDADRYEDAIKTLKALIKANQRWEDIGLTTKRWESGAYESLLTEIYIFVENHKMAKKTINAYFDRNPMSAPYFLSQKQLGRYTGLELICQVAATEDYFITRCLELAFSYRNHVDDHAYYRSVLAEYQREAAFPRMNN